MRKVLLIASILISGIAYGQTPQKLGSASLPVYNPGMFFTDSISSVFANLDTATVRAAFPTQRMFGRVGFANGLPYMFTGVNWIRMYGIDTSGLSNRIDAKENALGYVPEDRANKASVLTGSTDKYASDKAAYDYANGISFSWNAPNKTLFMVNTVSGLNLSSKVLYGLADSAKTVFNSDSTTKFYTPRQITDSVLAYVDVRSFGAKGDSSTISDHAINSAIDYANSHGIREVRIPDGWYLIDSAIIIKDNIHIIADGATIELLPNSNDYILKNEDLFGGNSDMEVSGGRWIGNFGTQQISFSPTSDIDTSYYGFGFFFIKSSNIYLHDLIIERTQTWGIAHILNNGFTCKRIKFKQAVRDGFNGDGITGSSSNVTIDDISGYTNDDMVGVLVTPGGFASQGVPLGNLPIGDVSNWSISNIKPGLADSSLASVDSAYGFRAVRIFSGFDLSVKNINIVNVGGTTYSSPILIDSYDSSAIMHDINISNVNTLVRNTKGSILGYIGFRHLTWLDNINISNISRVERSYTGYPTFLARYSNIGNINISNVQSIQQGVKNDFFSDINSNIKAINISNVYHSDSTFSSTQTLYRKNTGSIANLTRINANGVRVVDTANIVVKTNANSQFSLNTMSFKVDTSSLTPQAGDVIMSTNYGLGYYTTKWNFTMTSPLLKQGAYNLFGADVGTGTLNWNDATNTMPGFSPTLLRGSETNGPGGSLFYHPFTIEFGTSKNSTGNLTQFAFPYNPNVSDGIFWRSRFSGVWTSWRKIMDGSNGQLGTYTSTQRDALTPTTGQVIFCSNCTATDASTGVQQTWNGSAWKNAW